MGSIPETRSPTSSQCYGPLKETSDIRRACLLDSRIVDWRKKWDQFDISRKMPTTANRWRRTQSRTVEHFVCNKYIVDISIIIKIYLYIIRDVILVKFLIQSNKWFNNNLFFWSKSCTEIAAYSFSKRLSFYSDNGMLDREKNSVISLLTIIIISKAVTC